VHLRCTVFEVSKPLTNSQGGASEMHPTNVEEIRLLVAWAELLAGPSLRPSLVEQMRFPSHRHHAHNA
jgi:hypothetical protein